MPEAFERKGLFLIQCTQAHRRQESGRLYRLMISCGACQQSLWDGWRIFILVRPPWSALAAVRNPSNIYPGFRSRLQFSPAIVLAFLPPRWSTPTLYFHPSRFPSSIRRHVYPLLVAHYGEKLRAPKRASNCHPDPHRLLTVFRFSSLEDAMLKPLPALFPNLLATSSGPRVEFYDKFQRGADE